MKEMNKLNDPRNVKCTLSTCNVVCDTICAQLNRSKLSCHAVVVAEKLGSLKKKLEIYKKKKFMQIFM